jgi:hypothetical protein
MAVAIVVPVAVVVEVTVVVIVTVVEAYFESYLWINNLQRDGLPLVAGNVGGGKKPNICHACEKLS